MISRLCGIVSSCFVCACFSPNLGATGDDSTGSGSSGQATSSTVADAGTAGPATTDDDTKTTTSGTTPPTTSTSPTGDDTAAETLGTTDGGDTTRGNDDTGSTETGTEDSTTETGEEADITIYEIRQGGVLEDSEVEIRDVIVTGVGDNGFYVQEPTSGMESGIWAFTGVAGGPPLPSLGDVVDITGVYEEFFSRSEIDVSDGSVTVTDSPGPGNVPAVEVLTVLEVGEAWEGVLVRIEGDTFTVAEIGLGPQDDFRVSDSAAASVWVDDDIYDVVGAGDFAGFGIGASFTAIQGPVSYAFDEFTIVPRSMSDLSGYQQ